ncbi:MAG: PAS domain S-box protein [SAR324 cluster bacterium]|nr:PAS domain S-box protein [SAR324 cluster bacterium]
MDHDISYDELVNKITELQIILRDSVKNEKVLIKTKNQIQFIADNSPAYMAYVGADDLRYKFVNRQFEIAFNRSREQIVGQHIKTIIGESNFKFALKYIEIVRSGKAISYENTFNIAQGKRWVQVNYTPDFDQNRNVVGIVVLSYDVTEQKSTEEALLQIKARLLESQKFAKLGWWELDISSNQLSWSDELYEIFGISHDEDPLSYTRMMELIHSDYKMYHEQNMNLLLDLGNAEFEYPINRPDGMLKWIWTRGQLQHDETGKTSKMYGVIQDITERKQTEEALRAGEERLKLVIRGSNDAPWDWDLVTNELYYSPQWWKQLGYEPNELPVDAALWQRIMNPEDDAHVNEVFGGALNNGKESYEVEFRLLHKDGHYVPVLSRGFITRNKEGIPVRVTGTNMDLTERKRSEEALRAGEEKLRSVLDSSPFPTALVDLQDVNIYFWSRSALNLFGHTAPTTSDWYQIAYPDPDYRKEVIERWKSLLAEARETQKPLNTGEYRISCKDGSTRICELYATFITENLIVTFNDITERKQIEAEKGKLESQLHQSQKLEALGTLAGGIAHEFNNILAIMQGYTELGLRKLPVDSDVRNIFNTVHKSGLRAVNLASQILTFSRMNTTRFEILDPVPLIKESINMLRVTIPANIEIKTNIPGNCGKIKGDATQIHQVLVNLVNNAFHAVEKNQGRIEVFAQTLKVSDLPIRCSLEQKNAINNCFQLIVKDTGIGIPKQNLNQIFDPFFTTKGVGEGTGLGLAVVHGIVQKHEGCITVDSVEGIGTSVNVFFPLVEEARGRMDLSEKDKILIRGKGRILVADDEPMLVTFYQDILESLGYTVTTCNDGLKLLKVFSDNPNQFDLVFTDMAMPHMTGKQLSQELLRIRPDLPIIIASGYSNEISDDEAKALGIRAYLMKPVELKVLSKIIDDCMKETGPDST